MLPTIAGGASMQKGGCESAPDRAMQEARTLLCGEWRGSAWVELQPGRRDELEVEITVSSKADGSALLLDVSYGVRRPAAAGQPDLHDEMAVLSFDEEAQAYRFDIFFSSGRRETGSGRLDGAVLEILGSIREGGRRRLTLDRSDPDEWREKAEIAADGARWRTYYDSRLLRRVR
jgi:hypothetical protein